MRKNSVLAMILQGNVPLMEFMFSRVRKNHYERNFIIAEKNIMGLYMMEKDGIAHLKPLLMHW